MIFTFEGYHAIHFHRLEGTTLLHPLIGSCPPLCRLATPATFLLTSNDPSGFNLIDVLAYGSLGHALGYTILAVNSLNVIFLP